VKIVPNIGKARISKVETQVNILETDELKERYLEGMAKYGKVTIEQRIMELDDDGNRIEEEKDVIPYTQVHTLMKT